MIKNLIFDLDNTIIKDDYDLDSVTYKEAFRKCGYSDENYEKIYLLIDIYNDECINSENIYYNKKDLLNFANASLNENYDIKLIDSLCEVVGKYWTREVCIKEDLLEKLSKKYDLYVFTNFFEESQSKRLETVGYLKYFKNVFGADRFGCKRFKKSFENVLNYTGLKNDECIMIGDNKAEDICGANSVGMKAILYDYNGKRDDKKIVANNYVVINSFDNLEKVLSTFEN